MMLSGRREEEEEEGGKERKGKGRRKGEWGVEVVCIVLVIVAEEMMVGRMGMKWRRGRVMLLFRRREEGEPWSRAVEDGSFV